MWSIISPLMVILVSRFWGVHTHKQHCNKILVHISLYFMLNVLHSCDTRCPGIRLTVLGNIKTFSTFCQCDVYFIGISCGLIYISDVNSETHIHILMELLDFFCKVILQVLYRVLSFCLIFRTSLYSPTDAY